MTDPRAQVVIDGNVGPLRQALREGAAAMTAFGTQSSQALGGIGSAASSFKTQMLGIIGVITGGAFSAFIKSQVNLQDEFSKSAQKAGVTTEQFSGMAYAAKLANLETLDLTKAYAKLAASLTDAQQGQKESVELFKRLKLDPKNFQDSDQLLLAMADRFEAMDDGAKKTSLAIDAFGEKLGPKLIPFLNSGRAGIENLRKEAAALGVVVSTQAGRDAEKFNDSLTTMHTALQGAGMEIGKVLIPQLTEAAEFFVKAAKETNVWEAALLSVGRVIAKGFGLDDVGKLESKLAGLRKELITTPPLIQQVRDTLARDPGNATAAKDLADMTARYKSLNGEILKTIVEIARLKSSAGDAGAGRGFVNPQRVQGTPFVPDAKTPTAGTAPKEAPTGYMQYYELLLAEEKRVQTMLDAGREYSKEQELAYWRWLSANAELTAADRIAVQRRMATLEVEIAQKTARDKAAIDGELVNQAEAAHLGELDAQRARNQVALDLEQITKAQFLQADAQYEQQRYEIQRAALVQRLQLLADDPNGSELAKLQLNGKLLELDRQYAVKRIEILGGIAKEGASTGAMWDSMTSGFGSALQGLVARTQTWAGAIGQIFAGVRDAFIRYLITEPLAKWVAGQAQMLAAKLGFLAAEQAAQGVASAVIVGEKEIEATAVVGANAAEAGSGAAASQASIPYVGPYLALAAMAAVFAAVMALGSRSARGGYDIPSGINPLTQLHEEEMVLPSEQANVIRRLAGDPSAGAAPQDHAPVHIHTQGGDFIHKRDLAKLLKQMKRNFVFVE